MVNDAIYANLLAEMDTIYQNPEVLKTRNSGWVKPHLVEKPWGSELLICITDNYVQKILKVLAGHKLSFQYHEEKTETLWFESGEGILTVSNEGDLTGPVRKEPIQAGTVYHMNPFTRHTFEAITNLTMVEVSTPQIYDVRRISDLYGRKDSVEKHSYARAPK